MYYKRAYFSYSLIPAIYIGLNIFNPKLQSQTQVSSSFSWDFLGYSWSK